MSQVCAIKPCKYSSFAVCHCCYQNLCAHHLNNHYDLLTSQLDPLKNEINALSDRLKVLNIETIIGHSRYQLERWRLECHTTIDRIFEQKCRELDRCIKEKVNRQQAKLYSIRSAITKRTEEQELTRQDIDVLLSKIGDIKQELNTIEQTSIRVHTRPLEIDDSFIEIKQSNMRKFDLSTLPLPFRKVKISTEYPWALASNDRFMLIHQKRHLCLINQELKVVDEVKWKHGCICDISWSSAISRFIVLTANNGIFLVNESSMSIEHVKTIGQHWWYSCTCSDTFLFLTTNMQGSPIMKFSLLPSIELVKEWKSPRSCTEDEFICDIGYNDGALALILRNQSSKTLRLELRSATTLDRFGSFQLDLNYTLSTIRFCLLNSDEWLVIDPNTDCLLHITKDGKTKTTCKYERQPISACLLGQNMLVISREKEINFYKL